MVDELNRKGLAEVMAVRIRSIRRKDDQEKQRGPFRINLYGPWGSGKSSILSFLSRELKRNPRKEARKDPAAKNRNGEINQVPWVIVEFNAWQHQRLGAPWWFLIDTVYRQSARQLWTFPYFRRFKLTVTERCWRILASRASLLLAAALVLWMLVLSIQTRLIDVRPDPAASKGLLESLAGQAENLSKILALIATVWGIAFGFMRGFFLGSAQSAKSFQQHRSDPMRSLCRHFKKILGRVKRPVAVFIDDLDRCNDTYVVELLEGIQTVFGDAPVTYVIAADRRWVRTAYQNVYAKFADAVKEPGRSLGMLLLEKTFQLSVPVPCMCGETQREYWQRLIGLTPQKREEEIRKARVQAREEMKDLTTEEAVLAKVKSAGPDPVIQRAYRAEGLVRLAAADVSERTEHALRPFAPLVEGNPRAMKRLVNSYGVQRALAMLAKVEISQKQLALWTILDMRWPDLAEYLENHPDEVDQIKEEPDLKDVPKELHALFKDQQVIDVVNGKADGVNARLDMKTIEDCDLMRS